MKKKFLLKSIAKICLILLHIVCFFEYFTFKTKQKMLKLKRYKKLGVIDTTVLYMCAFGLIGAMISLVIVGFVELKSAYIVAGSIIGVLGISLIIITDNQNYGRK